MLLPCASAATAGARGGSRGTASGIALLAAGVTACAPTDGAPPLAAASAPRFPKLVDMVLIAGPRDSESGVAADLLVDRFEVTDGEFAEFVAATGYEPPDPQEFLRHWQLEDGRRIPVEPDAPVRHVSLADAEAYARWRGKSLPTRDEWLRACPSLVDGELPWQSRAFTGACNSSFSELGAPMPVGSYELGRTDYGCYDVIGNVAEWTTTNAHGPELRYALGGSFQRHCQEVAPRRRTSLGALRLRGDRGDPTARDEAALAPWQEPIAVETRRDDIGLRCVVRDVAAVLDAAFDEAERLDGAPREAAIAELLELGKRPFDDNLILPFVRARAFERRVRVDLQLQSDRGGPFRGELEPTPDGSDLMACEPGVLRRLSGRDGSVRRRIELPFADATARAPWLAAPWGEAAGYVVGPRGEIALFSLDGDRIDVAPAPDEGAEAALPTFLVSDARADGAVWFVQQLRVAAPTPLGAEERVELLPMTRLVRFDARGAQARLLPGALYVTPPPAGGDGVVVLTLESISVELPAGSDSADGRKLVPLEFEWVNAALIGADLATRSRWLISADERRAEGGAELHWRFAPEGGGAPAVDVRIVANAPQRYLRPLARANCYLLDDGAGRPWLFCSEAGRLLPPVPVDLPTRATVIPSAEGDSSEPFLLSLDGERLFSIAEGTIATALVDGLALGGQPTFAARSPDRETLVLRSRNGRWVGLSLRARRRAFAVERTDEASIVERLFAAGDGGVLVSQPTTHSAWIRRLRDGALVDSIGRVRPPLSRVVVVDADRDGDGEAWTLLGGGRLVALREPEAASARLAADCEAAWRRRLAGIEGGR
ncbi:MAG: SUMF1/EgtB/PvdO family nonheme iron enzyme [Planctomycetes bacterium]|nr:SUMF1/EgtB/PvdO family nonheme iron enzyme [Planctomycetota bacterium]